MSLLIPLAIAAAMLSQGGSDTVLKLKTGDVLTINAPGSYGGDFTVMNDGAIYGRGFGRVQVAGLNILDSEKAIRIALRKFVKEQNVFILLKSQQPDFVFLVGQTNGQGPTPWQPNMTLRQLISNVNLPSAMDQIEVSVLRNGQFLVKSSVQDAIQGMAGNDVRLSPNDVVSVMPFPTMRVWVSGAVKTPGEIKIQEGSDLSRTLAAAGGISERSIDEAEILVRRGPNVAKYPARDIAKLDRIPIQAGDDVSVVLPQETRVTVAGEIVRPGEVVLRGETLLTKALASAGGATKEGTLTQVRVIRQGEMMTFDASKASLTFALQPNDLVVIERNQRTFYILGEVNKPGRYLMEDNRTYRVSDALSAADGLGGRGTYRRAYLARAGADGKTVMRQFNLDEFLKDGKLESNPLLESGDCILFGQSNGLSLNAANQVLSSFLILNSLVGKR